MPDMERLLAAVGHFAVNTDLDERIDMPLEQQVEELMAWACSAKPRPFKRHVPVEATDHDVLITSALGRLVALLRDLSP